MNVLAGLFLIAHGLVHVAIWVPEPQEGHRSTRATRGHSVRRAGSPAPWR